ncbi:solute carrier family 23 member 1-like [Mizuhopecten yessoensis]|uniref:Solute carrier family 23 member 2 n=1 Tax=Mizuhopecten yessoensis TaxID=6573 RepID=A0A210R274_MIZYE|nr:solute carrier family 23 member 1-like [Mizuhopecten yessoensis]OWF55077.1 Solute carrier family 23 member 2 [Mizuhopecten yessoensis]
MEGSVINEGFEMSEQKENIKYLDVPATNGTSPSVEKRQGFKGSTEKSDDGQRVLPAISTTIQKEEAETEQTTTDLIYKISSYVPPHLTLMFAFQQALLSISGSLAVSLLVAEVVCAEDNDEFKAKLLSSTLFMNGLTTFLMVTLGIRLPLYQGATTDYVAPLLAMSQLDTGRCNGTRPITVFNNITNTTETKFPEGSDEIILHSIQALQGSLLAAGAVHFLLGATGLVGFLLRFIGPITIVPTILLIGIYMTKAVIKFAQVNWPLSLMTCAIAIILSLYLAKMKTPLPMWSRKKSWHVIRYPLHQVFAILIALVVGWVMCAVLTTAGMFSMDRDHKDFYSRTDARTDIVQRASWFHFPYPGQFGPMRFDVSVFVGFMVATIVSILDSIGDYYACASICKVPPPPAHGVNRGIAIEGFCSALSGVIGCGHATTTYGGNIGAIGLTRVASRYVFMAVALIYIIFGLIGKVSAVFITIPYPVLGGVLMVMFGAFNGVVLSNLQAVSLSSTRNLTIIGTALFVGLMVPQWVKDYDKPINTGNKDADDVITMLLGNPNLTGGVLACFLDNTIPGTREERGLAAWEALEDNPSANYSEGYEVYNPLFFDKVKHFKILKFLPFMPAPQVKGLKRKRFLSLDLGNHHGMTGAYTTTR